EIFAGSDSAADGEADGEDEKEVEREDRVVDPAERHLLTLSEKMLGRRFRLPSSKLHQRAPLLFAPQEGFRFWSGLVGSGTVSRNLAGENACPTSKLVRPCGRRLIRPLPIVLGSPR